VAPPRRLPVPATSQQRLKADDQRVPLTLQEAPHGDENNGATYDQRTTVTAKHTPKQLGQMLLEQGLLTQQQLEIALRQHRNTPKSLGRTLIDLGYIRERDLVRALAKQVGLDFVDLRVHHIDPVAAALVPDQLARRYRALPIGERDGKLLVAMSDPANLYALDDIRAVTSREVQPVVATASDVEDAIDKFAATSFGDLHAVPQESEGTAPGGVRPTPDEPTNGLPARPAYAGMESQTRTSLPPDASIKRLVNATWVLAGTTVSLIFVTIVLIFVTART
jgi:CBS domain-containing protein